MENFRDQIYKALELYAITDKSWIKPGEKLLDITNEVLLGGATMLQLRDKELTGEALYQEALELKSLCAKLHIPFIINDDLELAVRIQADGLHLGQDDLKGRNIRELIGPDMLLGITAKTIEQAQAAEAAGADYLGVGAVFGSTTKKNALPLSIEALTAITGSVDIPVVAIGGITQANVQQLESTGIAGVAVVSALYKPENHREATAKMLKTVQNMLIDSKELHSPLEETHKYAIFDMDGTIIDSMVFWRDLAGEYLRSLGVHTDWPKLLEFITPMPIPVSSAYFVDRFKLPLTPEQVAQGLVDCIAQHYFTDIPAKPQVKAYLESLKQQGVKLCLASASSEKLAKACLIRLGLWDYFEFFISCEEAGSKKEPRIFLTAMKRLGAAEPSQVTVYEDAIFAIQTAKKAGFHTVAVYDKTAAKRWHQLQLYADNWKNFD